MNLRLTDRELDVMSILWRDGSGTVSEVRERLSDELAYTTVLWVLQTLETKGYVRHETEGRAYRYHPTVGPEAAGGSALSRIVDKVYHGSAELLLAQLVSERDLEPEELERMRDLLDRRLVDAGGEAEGGRAEDADGPARGSRASNPEGGREKDVDGPARGSRASNAEGGRAEDATRGSDAPDGEERR